MTDETRAEMTRWAEAGPLDAAAARAFVDANVGAALAPDLDADVLAQVRASNPRAWTGWVQRGSTEDWSARVGVLDVPALLVAGAADRDLGAGSQREHNGPVYPRANVAVRPGVRHFLHVEDPAGVAGLLQEFWTADASRAPEVPPSYAALVASPRVSPRTRGAFAQRAVADDPAAVPAALDPAQLATLRTVARAVLPGDDATAVDLAVRVDARLASGVGDGWRFADLPDDLTAYRAALDALAGLSERDAADVLRAVADGRHPGGGALTAPQLAKWFEDCRADLVAQWLAHPAALAHIGFDGFADGVDPGVAGAVAGRALQGYLQLTPSSRDAWEPVEVTG